MTAPFLKTVIALLSASFALSAPVQAKIATGATIPDLTLKDSNGTVHHLADYKGKTIVLEWTNHLCPYVQKHYNQAYNGGNMQSLQKAAAGDDVIWLSVISSAPGKQGYVSGETANALSEQRGAAPAAVILDPAGEVGRTFSAKATPHMYVIDAAQTLVYQVAIDNNRSADPATIAGATNYVAEALLALEKGMPVKKGETNPYGCQIKY